MSNQEQDPKYVPVNIPGDVDAKVEALALDMTRWKPVMGADRKLWLQAFVSEGREVATRLGERIGKHNVKAAEHDYAAVDLRGVGKGEDDRKELNRVSGYVIMAKPEALEQFNVTLMRHHGIDDTSVITAGEGVERIDSEWRLVEEKRRSRGDRGEIKI